MGPPDPIVGLNEAFAEDDSPHKINVGVGAYRSDDGLPLVLPCVREAEQIITNNPNLNHEYLGMVGDPQFVNLALKFVYGEDSKVLSENRVAAVQTLSGTGGLRVFGELLAKKGGHGHIYVPDPTWGNHKAIFMNSGLEVRTYRYYDAENSDLQFENTVKDIKEMPEGSVVLLHACAHNVSSFRFEIDIIGLGLEYIYIYINFSNYSLHSAPTTKTKANWNGSNNRTMG